MKQQKKVKIYLRPEIKKLVLVQSSYRLNKNTQVYAYLHSNDKQGVNITIEDMDKKIKEIQNELKEI